MDVEGTELYAAAAFDGGYVAGGCRLGSPPDEGACAEARILHSTDGRTWSDAEVTDSAGRLILGFADTPLGLLAFGRNQAEEPPLTRSIWRSVDGSRWEPFSMPAPEPIVFALGFVLSGRTVLIGSDSTYDFSVETEAWMTTDGRSWSSGETPMVSKVAADPGIVAIGAACVDICPEDVPIEVHRSVDGLTWTRDAPDAELATGDIRTLGAWAGRAVVGGIRNDAASAGAAVWLDEPGGWRTVSLVGGAGYAIDALIDTGELLIAIGDATEGGPGRAWWTADGRTWENGPLDGLDAGAFVAAWAGHDPIVVVVDYRSIWLTAPVTG
jgi:hypothetical protein